MELAARIGQSLLEKNNELNCRNEQLEQRLSALNEIVAQLHHKLELKSDLLTFYTQALDSADDDDEQKQPTNHNRPSRNRSHSPPRDRSASCSVSVQVDPSDTIDNGLVENCLKQLNYLSEEVDRLTSEVAVKTTQVIQQQQEIEDLTEQIASLQLKLTQSDDDNTRMNERLEEAKDAQTILVGEVGDLKGRYDECLELLREAQQEIRTLKKRQRTSRAVVHYFSTPSTSNLDKSDNSTSQNRSQTTSNSLLMSAIDTPTCSCGRTTQRRISSDCDSDGGYAADSDSVLESLLCSPNPTQSTASPSLPTLPASPTSSNGSTPKFIHSRCLNLGNRIKIVKNFEGSVALHRWQSLAQPNLSASALERIPGVLAKEQDPVDGVAFNHLHNIEEGKESLLSIATGGFSGEKICCHPEDEEDFIDSCDDFRPAACLLNDEEDLVSHYFVI